MLHDVLFGHCEYSVVTNDPDRRQPWEVPVEPCPEGLDRGRRETNFGVQRFVLFIRRAPFGQLEMVVVVPDIGDIACLWKDGGPRPSNCIEHHARITRLRSIEARRRQKNGHVGQVVVIRDNMVQVRVVAPADVGP